MITSASEVDIDIRPGDDARTIISSGDKGALQIGEWSELIESAGAITGSASNAYIDRSAGAAKYRRSHSEVGASALVHNSADFQTTSVFHAPPGTADDPVNWTESLRIDPKLSSGGLPAGETALHLRYNGSGAAFEQVEVGPVDSAGMGFRVLRVPN